MYLVHARLRAPTATELPPETAQVLTGCALPADCLEHVTVHPRPPGVPETGGECVLGLFLNTASLAHAEEAALRLCLRAVAGHRLLRGFEVVSAGAVLVPGPWDPMARSGGVPGEGGQLMPLPDPSSRNPFHPF